MVWDFSNPLIFVGLKPLTIYNLPLHNLALFCNSFHGHIYLQTLWTFFVLLSVTHTLSLSLSGLLIYTTTLLFGNIPSSVWQQQQQPHRAHTRMTSTLHNTGGGGGRLAQMTVVRRNWRRFAGLALLVAFTTYRGTTSRHRLLPSSSAASSNHRAQSMKAAAVHNNNNNKKRSPPTTTTTSHRLVKDDLHPDAIKAAAIELDEGRASASSSTQQQQQRELYTAAHSAAATTTAATSEKTTTTAATGSPVLLFRTFRKAGETAGRDAMTAKKIDSDPRIVGGTLAPDHPSYGFNAGSGLCGGTLVAPGG
jgi:hypothetical protein